MNSCNVLSALWEKKITYTFIDELLLLESTFIQQTSKGESLWKAQLGMTKNYIIFLRCNNEIMLNLDSNFRQKAENVNILVNMIPMSHIRVKKHSKRTLEILFPSGSLCYFKLFFSPGCGKAWSLWRTLEQICDRDILPLAPESRLIPFLHIDSDIQRSLINQKFLVCFIALEKYVTENADSTTGESFSDKSGFFTTDDSGLDSCMSLSTLHSSMSRYQTEIAEIRNRKHEETGTQDILSHLSGGRKKKNTRKKKQVCRFGEGIPDNCVFGLSLSYSDEQAREKVKTDLEKGGYHIQKKGTTISLKETKRVAEGSKCKTTRSKDKNVHDNRKEDDDYMHTESIFKATQFFTNVSLLVVPGGLRRSKSVDSISEISPKTYKRSYLTSNISLPDVHELILYRRYNRLSYSFDYFADTPSIDLRKDHSIHGISFWLPGNKSRGRIYCTTPICRKISAYNRKAAIARRVHLSQYDVIKALLNNRLHNVHPKCPSQITDDVGKHTYFSMNEEATSGSFETLYEEDNVARHLLRGGSLEKFSTTSSSSSSHKITRNNLDSSNKKRITEGSIETKLLDPYEVAYELQRIQQRMFCEIETPEIMRFILKPHTVTEVNCPYLCGYLFFFERLKNLVATELSVQSELEDAARTHRLFVQVAIECFKKRDEQSAYAVTAGLCNPIIPGYNKLWSHILHQSEDVKYLSLLFRYCWSRNKGHRAEQKIPFYLDFVALLVESLIKETQNSFLAIFEKESLWEISKVSKNFHRRNFYTRDKRVFAELRILSEGNLENAIKIIEECRKYYTYKEVSNFSTTDITIKEYLLLQQYNN